MTVLTEENLHLQTEPQTETKTITVLLVALCSYRNFPIRVLHPLLERIKGVSVHSVFVKEFEGRLFTHPTEIEQKLFIDLVLKLKPQLVGFSVLYPFFPMTKTLMKLIKKHSPETLICLGGHHPTTSPEICVNQSPEADILCIGDGDQAFVEIIETLRDNKPFHELPNFWVRHQGEIFRNPRKSLMQDLDAMPFPAYCNKNYYFIDHNKITQTDPLPTYKDLYVIGSRGCPFLCTFCGNTVLREDFKGLGKFIRRRSVDSLIAEIKEHLALPTSKTQYVYYFDENFSLEMDWLQEFCEKYKREINLPFQVSYNPHRLGPEIIKMLVDAGMDSLRIGIQTGSDFIRRKIYNRPGKNSDLIEITNNTAKYNISMRHDIILDNPYEAPEHIQEAIDLVLKLPKASHTDLYSLQYYPNFPLTKKAIEDKIIPPIEEISDRDMEKTTTDVGYVPHFLPLTKKQLLQNTLWLLSGDHVNSNLVRYGAFKESLGAKICLCYMHVKAVILGRLIGDGGLADKFPFLMLIVKAFAFLLKGDWKGFWIRMARRLRLKHTTTCSTQKQSPHPLVRVGMPWSKLYS